MKSILYLVLAAGLVLPAAAQQTPGGTQLVVTALAKHDQPAAGITEAQVQVKQGHNRLPVSQWAPFPASQRMDLTIAIDDDTENMQSGLDDVKTFIKQLPANVAVGIVYLRTGSFTVAENFTQDHVAAAAKVRMPSGARNSSPSPFGSLQNLVQHLPNHPGERREIVMISDGQEHTGGNDQNNHTLQAAIADAIAGGVVVYTIYASGGQHYAEGQVPNGQLVPTPPGQAPGTPGMAGTPLAVFRNSNVDVVNGSQNLSLLASDTGGQAYANGITSSTRLTQYFTDIAARMAAQYRLVIQPDTKNAHGMTRIEVKVNHSDANITAQKWIYLAPKS